MGEDELPADALHAYDFSRCGLLCRNVISFGMYLHKLYMTCPLTRCRRMSLAASAYCAAMFLGYVGYIITYAMPADVLRASDFGRCGLLCRNVLWECLIYYLYMYCPLMRCLRMI